jgi:hypothetical protein
VAVVETQTRSGGAAIAVASIAGILALTVLVVIPRVSRMNDFSAVDGDPVNIFAGGFVASMLVPFAGVGRRSRWAYLGFVQCAVAAVTCAVLFAFRPSGDGLYILPIALAAVVTAVGSIIATYRICRTPTP